MASQSRFGAVEKRQTLKVVEQARDPTGWTIRRVLRHLGLTKPRYGVRESVERVPGQPNPSSGRLSEANGVMSLFEKASLSGKVRSTTDRGVNKLSICVDYFSSPLTQPILFVSGFWRSGTTWVQEALAEITGAKTIFEPLHPYVTEYAEMMGEKNLAKMPSYTPEIGAYLSKAMIGRVRGHWVRTCRKGLLDSFQTTSIVKVVRGQFLLPAVSNRFGIPIIHISRSPFAVMASIMRNRWGDWLHDLNLSKALPREIYEKHHKAIQSHRKDPWWVQVAMLWAASEAFVSETEVLSISYERLCETPSDLFAWAERLKLPLKNRSITNRDSVMTVGARRGASTPARLEGWRRELSPEVQERLKEAIGSIHPLHLKEHMP